MTDDHKMDKVDKADKQLAGLAPGGVLTEKQADRFLELCTVGMNEPLQYGPIQQTGPPCGECEQPLGNVRYSSSDRTFCCTGCQDKYTLDNEREQLYVGQRENRWLVQRLEGRPALSYDINRSLWRIAFYPLWRQEVFDFTYGSFDNDVFTVRPYYWGDCTCGHEEREADWDRANKHDASCYHVAAAAIPRGLGDEVKRGLEDEKLQALCKRHGIPWNDGLGSRSHCTCEHDSKWRAFCAEHSHAADCALELPNFVYKPTAFELCWYKYPLRGTTVNQKLASYDVIVQMVQHCVGSLTG